MAVSVTEIIVSNSLSQVPLLGTILDSYVSGSTIGEIIVLNSQSLNSGFMFNSIFDSLTNVIMEIWLWLLYNLITPILLISFTIAFFVGQFYLIKLYIWIFKNTILKIVKVWGWIMGHKKVKQFVNNMEDDIMKSYSN